MSIGWDGWDGGGGLLMRDYDTSLFKVTIKTAR